MIEQELIENKQDYSSDNIEKIYKTINTYTLKTPAAIKLVDIQAEYKTISFSSLVSPADVKLIHVPAEYTSVTKQILTAKPVFRISEIEAPVLKKITETKKIGGDSIKVNELKNPSQDVIRQVQTRLGELTYYTGPNDGLLNPETLTALCLYQNKNTLPIGQFDKESLDQLQIKY